MEQTRIGKFLVSYENSEEFHTLKREIFSQHHYYVELETDSPKIIDAGAHIGMASLYFSSLWPKSNIVAFEPNDLTRKIFEENVFQNDLKNIEILPYALSDKEEEITLYRDATQTRWFSTAGKNHGAWNGQQYSEGFTCQAVSLLDYLDEPVDILKMDIEGSEQEVLLACGSQIRQAQHIFIEYHPTPDQSLQTILDFLSTYHFTYELWKEGSELKIEQALKYPCMHLIEAQRGW